MSLRRNATKTFKMHTGGAHALIVIVLVRHAVLSSLFFTSRLAAIRNSHTVRSNKNEIELTIICKHISSWMSMHHSYKNIAT